MGGLFRVRGLLVGEYCRVPSSGECYCSQLRCVHCLWIVWDWNWRSTIPRQTESNRVYVQYSEPTRVLPISSRASACERHQMSHPLFPVHPLPQILAQVQAQPQHDLVNPGHILAISCNPGIRGTAQLPTNACGSCQGRGSEQIAWTEGSSLRGDEGD